MEPEGTAILERGNELRRGLLATELGELEFLRDDQAISDLSRVLERSRRATQRIKLRRTSEHIADIERQIKDPPKAVEERKHWLQELGRALGDEEITENIIPITPKDREEIIKEKAFYLYLERGKEPGHAIEDWLTAENIVRKHFLEDDEGKLEEYFRELERIRELSRTDKPDLNSFKWCRASRRTVCEILCLDCEGYLTPEDLNRGLELLSEAEKFLKSEKVQHLPRNERRCVENVSKRFQYLARWCERFHPDLKFYEEYRKRFSEMVNEPIVSDGRAEPIEHVFYGPFLPPGIKTQAGARGVTKTRSEILRTIENERDKSFLSLEGSSLSQEEGGDPMEGKEKRDCLKQAEELEAALCKIRRDTAASLERFHLILSGKEKARLEQEFKEKVRNKISKVISECF